MRTRSGLQSCDIGLAESVHCEPEYRPDQRLDKEQLREESKRKVEADEFQPVCEKGENAEACIVGVIEEGSQKAHSRTHDSDCRTDNCGFKQNRVCFGRIKYLTCELE